MQNYDGVEVTFVKPRKPRKSEVTWPVEKSKYTPWTKGVAKFVRGSNGVMGTLRTLTNP